MTLTDSPQTGNTLRLVIGLFVTFLMVLMGVVIVTICLAAVVVRKRRATIRSLQLARWVVLIIHTTVRQLIIVRVDYEGCYAFLSAAAQCILQMHH